MKRFIVILILITMIFTAINADTKKKLGNMALLFTIENFPLNIEAYTDGIQAGMGLKFWIMENMALRGLFAYNSTTTNDVSQDPPVPDTTLTDFTIGLAGEYHWLPGNISPYAGALGGITMQLIYDHNPDVANQEDPTMDYYLGALFGVEAKIKEVDFLSIYAEYTFIINATHASTTVTLGAGSSARVGLLIYFM